VSRPLRPERHPGIRPRPTVWRRLDIAGRRALPVTFSVMLVLLLCAPLDLPQQQALLPGAAMGSVFFWSVFRPASMPALMVFLLGLLTDLLSFSPPGLAILTLLLVHAAGLGWRHGLARRGFLVVWLVFVLVAAGAIALDWALSCAFMLRLLPVQPVCFELALAAGCYPLLSALFTWAHRGMADPDRA
jgi:rod shape-determining protein MreD